MSESLSPPVARIVIIGASNVARGISTIVAVARHVFGSPLEIVTAMGHGRSYGAKSSIPFRTLPSVLECGLWQTIESRPLRPTYALLTDIGNDLIYGRTADELVAWVKSCTARLRPQCDQIAITNLPLCSIEKVGPARFQLFRRLFFPTSNVPLVVARRYALNLDRALCKHAREIDAALVAAEAHWYGFDPIHIRFRAQCEAWAKIFSALARKDFRSPTQCEMSLYEHARVMMVRPQWSIVLSRERVARQPSVMLRDGTTISFY